MIKNKIIVGLALLFITCNLFAQIQGGPGNQGNVPLHNLRHSSGPDFVIRSGVGGKAEWVKDSIYFPKYFNVASAPLTAKKGDFWRSTANQNTYFWDGIDWRLLAKKDTLFATVDTTGLSNFVKNQANAVDRFSTLQNIGGNSAVITFADGQQILGSPFIEDGIQIVYDVDQQSYVFKYYETDGIIGNESGRLRISNDTLYYRNSPDSLENGIKLAFAATNHNHTIGNITNLQDSLNRKANVSDTSKWVQSGSNIFNKSSYVNITKQLSGNVESENGRAVVIDAGGASPTSVQLHLKNTFELGLISGQDYANEVHLRLQAGKPTAEGGTSHRAYFNFADNNGVDKWLLGRNAGNNWIHYDSESNHRMWMQPLLSGTTNFGYTYLNSAGTGAVEINNMYQDGDDLGTGGFGVYAGGLRPGGGRKAMFKVNPYLTTNPIIEVESGGGGYAPASLLMKSTNAVSRGQGIFYRNEPAQTSWYSGISYNSNSTKWMVGFQSESTFDPSVSDLSASKFTIQSDGKLGIGTSTPSYKLDVTGDVRISDRSGTATTAAGFDANGKIVERDLPNVSNITGLQDSLLSKAPIVHTHTVGQVTGLQDSLDARPNETTASIQSKRPIKAIESQSLEGSGNIDLVKADVGLSNVDNTSDVNKPISTATQAALSGKVGGSGSIGKYAIFNGPNSVETQYPYYDYNTTTSYFNSLRTIGPIFTSDKFIMSNGRQYEWIGEADKTRLFDASGGTTLQTWLANGNVGISTTNPLATLHVNGTMGLGSYETGDRLTISGQNLSGGMPLRISDWNPSADALSAIEINATPTASNYVNTFFSSVNFNGSSQFFHGNNHASGRANFRIEAATPTINLNDGTNGDWLIGLHKNSNSLRIQNVFDINSTGANVMTMLKSNGNVGIGTINPTEKLEVNGGIKITSQTAPLSDNTIYHTSKDILKFGPSKNIHKSIVHSLSLNQSTSFNAGDYWDLFDIPYLDFGTIDLSIETSGNSNGSVRKYSIPLSYALDIYYQLGITTTDGVWFYLSSLEDYSRAWGQNFNNNFQIAIRISTGTVKIRLVCINSGEIRGAPYDYGSVDILTQLKSTEFVTKSTNVVVGSDSGVGMTLPSQYLPKYISGKNSHNIFESSVVIGNNYKNVIPNSTNQLLVSGNVGIGTTTPSTKLDVNGNIKATIPNYATRAAAAADSALTSGSMFRIDQGDGTSILHIKN